jgi:hypothetical protein
LQNPELPSIKTQRGATMVQSLAYEYDAPEPQGPLGLAPKTGFVDLWNSVELKGLEFRFVWAPSY